MASTRRWQTEYWRRRFRVGLQASPEKVIEIQRPNPRHWLYFRDNRSPTWCLRQGAGAMRISPESGSPLAQMRGRLLPSDCGGEPRGFLSNLEEKGHEAFNSSLMHDGSPDARA
jgi:hypothetical protein